MNAPHKCLNSPFRTVTDLKDCTVVTQSKVQLPVASKSPLGGKHAAVPGSGSSSGVLYDLALDSFGQLAVTVGQVYTDGVSVGHIYSQGFSNIVIVFQI